METQMETDRSRSHETSEHLREAAEQQRNQSERLARQLSTEAMKQWQRSVEGLLALPTATALGVASSTLWMASLVARSFEVLQRSTEAIRAGMEESRREMSGQERGRAESGGRARSDASRTEVRA